MDVMLQANETLQLQTLTERDVRIDVEMGDIGTADFERVPDTIPLGEAATRAAADRWHAWPCPSPEYLAWRQKVTASQDIEARLADVRYEGLERVNPAYLEQQAQVRAGDTVDTAKISAEAQRMSALQEFESVEYRLVGDPANPTLVWMPREKQVGPDYLKFDLGMYASEGGDIAFAIYAKHHRTWLNSLGAEWRNEVQLGSENLLATEPLPAARRRASLLRRAAPDVEPQLGVRLPGRRATRALPAERRGRQPRHRHQPDNSLAGARGLPVHAPRRRGEHGLAADAGRSSVTMRA